MTRQTSLHHHHRSNQTRNRHGWRWLAERKLRLRVRQYGERYLWFESISLHHAVPANRRGFRVGRNPRNFGRLARRVAVCEPNSSWGDVSSSVGGAGPDRPQPEEAVSVPIRAGDRLGDLRKAGSSRGANVPSPPLPGETVTIPPPIPLLTLVVIHLVGINITGTSVSNPERVAQ